MSGPVIVFGPTGNIGRVAARTAQENGAKVFLAMRNVEKAIPGLSSDEEKASGFERIQADLTEPDTVSAAVKKAGAKRAFIYLAWGKPDHMKGTIEALKSAGIELVVFISSYTVGGDPHKCEPAEIIAYAHAQVEINLEEVFGPSGYVAIRPGTFATNTLFWKSGIVSGELKLYSREMKFDYISALDMGRVSGTILAKGPQDGQKIVYLYGPNLTAQEDAAILIAKGLGKDLVIAPMNEQEAVDNFIAGGMPDVVAKYLVARLSAGGTAGLEPVHYSEGVSNIKKYSGKPAMNFQEWVDENKGLFT